MTWAPTAATAAADIEMDACAAGGILDAAPRTWMQIQRESARGQLVSTTAPYAFPVSAAAGGCPLDVTRVMRPTPDAGRAFSAAYRWWGVLCLRRSLQPPKAPAPAEARARAAQPSLQLLLAAGARLATVALVRGSTVENAVPSTAKQVASCVAVLSDALGADAAARTVLRHVVAEIGSASLYEPAARPAFMDALQRLQAAAAAAPPSAGGGTPAPTVKLMVALRWERVGRFSNIRDALRLLDAHDVWLLILDTTPAEGGDWDCVEATAGAAGGVAEHVPSHLPHTV